VYKKFPQHLNFSDPHSLQNIQDK